MAHACLYTVHGDIGTPCVDPVGLMICLREMPHDARLNTFNSFSSLSRKLTASTQILSRTKAVEVEPESIEAAKRKKKKALPKLDDFLAKRDYVGAITLVEVRPCVHLHA